MLNLVAKLIASKAHASFGNSCVQVGRSLFLLGKHRAAVDVYDEALKLESEEWELWFHKGMCASQTKDCDRSADAP